MAASFTPQMIAYYKAHADDTLQPNEIATGVCGTVIAYVAVIARVLARRASGSKFGWDDWLIVASLVSLIGYSSVVLGALSLILRFLHVSDPSHWICCRYLLLS